tara:strand:- start:1306 stop:1578 length:273 start_codon:yes stop_codon:yes gene_type:complete
MKAKTMTDKMTLPYPNSLNITVYSDDGKWEDYEKHFMRSSSDLQKLFVSSIILAHYEGEDDPDYSLAEWDKKSAELLKTYPNCIFVYTAS